MRAAGKHRHEKLGAVNVVSQFPFGVARVLAQFSVERAHLLYVRAFLFPPRVGVSGKSAAESLIKKRDALQPPFFTSSNENSGVRHCRDTFHAPELVEKSNNHGVRV